MTSYPPQQGTNLVDILDRVLDKGLVVAGDIKISLANVELLTIKIRLLVCSIDKAEQIGLNWWRYDQSLVHQATDRIGGDNGAGAIAGLEARIAELEGQLQRIGTQEAATGGRPAARSGARRGSRRGGNATAE